MSTNIRRNSINLFVHVEASDDEGNNYHPNQLLIISYDEIIKEIIRTITEGDFIMSKQVTTTRDNVDSLYPKCPIQNSQRHFGLIYTFGSLDGWRILNADEIIDVLSSENSYEYPNHWCSDAEFYYNLKEDECYRVSSMIRSLKTHISSGEYKNVCEDYF